MPEERTLNLVDRLRGKYVLPVNDGAGPLNGKTTFTREFETPPIQHEAAAEIERLRALAQAVADESMYPVPLHLREQAKALLAGN